MKCHPGLGLACLLMLGACAPDKAGQGEEAYLPPAEREARTRAEAQAIALDAAFDGAPWQLVDISGTPALGDVPATLSLWDDGGRVSGTPGCNQLNGRFEREDAQISFSGIATTRKLCPGPAMQQEVRFLDVLAGVISAGVNEDSELFLATLDGDTLHFVRASGQQDEG